MTVDFASDSIVINSLIADVVQEVRKAIAEITYIVGVTIKFCPGVKDKLCLNIIQLPTKTQIFVFKVRNV